MTPAEWWLRAWQRKWYQRNGAVRVQGARGRLPGHVWWSRARALGTLGLAPVLRIVEEIRAAPPA